MYTNLKQLLNEFWKKPQNYNAQIMQEQVPVEKVIKIKFINK